jgi:hypothetical protein
MTALGPMNSPTLKELVAGDVGDTCTEMSTIFESERGGVLAMLGLLL